MKVFFLLFATALSVEAFTSHFGSVRRHAFQQSASSSVLFSAETAAGVPPSTATPDSNVEDVTIPTNLPSDVGMDYIPLATMLATGQLAEADQFTRDALIVLAGSKEKGRDFVYFTEVKDIPSTDLATIERLWNRFSGGKFGYSVQKNVWRVTKGDFEKFCQKIGWTTTDGDTERKKRWFGASEFIYDVKKAPKGHLPLTSALRGTALIKKLLTHPVWDNDDWKKEP
uniref:GUN4-like domain-containing protein n=1 Tax=Corethron hystrix TaxID=216773 RepID=A0A7S1BZ28_9STRA|mmetsp:Transcript_5930/g.12570  ORF Transcript_5930/g.12570 Transcript_5930/m.12570 type:complete len:227 (+) Transcript_5930:105-785(+)|eukprot:CAMPEP_0113314594 /NCGR_PEP_ID=MMETSP0010_2-20120614/10589_1 /TAXON_ID=216773 ORGANISM="Corethron hystrix, Strain 308" /NCGR_SAMPLE_ID=MMETSP0010_2 /ASSEMBLY_ACC=CAM_ASM_000155 /LENGTH=226 /DNA_ID=CAMNT_0000170905 /DNA_START=99 /DNA_END=779 /DNA_ORIENTATION=- /assembly_acc=CAM_ASM_000155